MTKCEAALPFASTALWQLMQVPGAVAACVKLAGLQVVVRWQASQDNVVMTCRADFARAVAPL